MEKEERMAYFSLLGNTLEVTQIASPSILEGELGHIPSLTAKESGNSVILGRHLPGYKYSVALSEKWSGSHLDICHTPFNIPSHHLTTPYLEFMFYERLYIKQIALSNS